MNVVIDKTPASEKLPTPHRQWRNKWKAMTHIVLMDGREFRQGEVIDADRAWPSKDLAESVAAKDLATMLRDHGRVILAHVGAFPEVAP